MFRNVRDPISIEGFERDNDSRFELVPAFEEVHDTGYHGEYEFLDEIDQMFWS
jgi:hypothetical protein